MKLLGAVLAGGRSSRFGSDKALALFAGKPLIEHAIAALRPLVAEVVVCGRTYVGERWIPDRPAPDLGPLGGLNAALALAATEGFNAVLSLPCDAPLVARADLDHLLEHPGLAAFFAGLPVCGYWPVALASPLHARIIGDSKRSVRAWAASIGARRLDGPTAANVNTPVDLARLSAP